MRHHRVKFEFVKSHPKDGYTVGINMMAKYHEPYEQTWVWNDFIRSIGKLYHVGELVRNNRYINMAEERGYRIGIVVNNKRIKEISLSDFRQRFTSMGQY